MRLQHMFFEKQVHKMSSLRPRHQNYTGAYRKRAGGILVLDGGCEFPWGVICDKRNFIISFIVTILWPYIRHNENQVKPSLPITFLREFSRNKDCIKTAMTANESPRTDHSTPIAEHGSFASSGSASESVQRIPFSCWKLLFGRKISPG